MHWSDVTPHLTGYAHLATVDATGVPHVSRVAAIERDGEIVFFTDWASRKVKNLQANPQASIMFAPLAEAYVTGIVELIDDVSAKTDLWNSGLLGYDPSGFWQTPDNPEMVMVRFVPHSAVVMSMDAGGAHKHRWRR